MKENKQRQIFDKWLGDYRALLFKIIRAYTIHNENRDDLFQDICMQVYQSIPNFKGNSAASTWIYRIALNTAIKWSTKERKHVDGHQEIEGAICVLENKENDIDDRIAWLYKEIQQFNEIDKSLSLLLLEGYSYKSMSEILGISESNIGVKIHRIKKQLMKTAKDYEYGT